MIFIELQRLALLHTLPMGPRERVFLTYMKGLFSSVI